MRLALFLALSTCAFAQFGTGISVEGRTRRHPRPAAQQGHIGRSGPLRTYLGGAGAYCSGTHTRRLRSQSPDGPQHGGVRRHHEHVHARSANARVAGTHFGRHFGISLRLGRRPAGASRLRSGYCADYHRTAFRDAAARCRERRRSRQGNLQRSASSLHRGCETCSLGLEECHGHAREPGDAGRDSERRHSGRRRAVPILFGLAAGSMLDRRWDEVTEHLQAVEAETAKVVKVVGR